MDYATLSKETVSYLYQSYASLKKSPLDSQLRILAELRTSQINGCAYCCKLHIDEARTVNISQDKLDELVSWRTSTLFTGLERLALQWTDEVTDKNFNTNTKEALKQHLSERELVDLTACISIMNALNRMAICLRD